MNTLLAAAPIGGGPNVTGEGMTVANMTLLGIYLALAIGVSFLCSLLEAGLLSVPTSHVELMAKENRRGGARLKRMKTHVDRPLAAILTLNTVAHTVGAAGVGAQVLVIWGSGAVAIGSAVVTLLILVFSEIIPKSIGAAQAKPLAAFTAYAIQGMIWLTLPLLIPLQWISSRLGGGHAIQVTRDEVAITAELGHSAGEIGLDEINVIRNVLSLHETPVSQIMTPRPVVFTLPADATITDALAEHPTPPFTRIPLIEGDKDHFVGHVVRYEVFEARRAGRGDEPLRAIVKPLEEVADTDNVFDTFEKLVKSRRHLMRVVDQFGGTAGVVSLEDCVETILGKEIIDETDTADDLREVARKLLERRREERG